ncbi:MAG: hypothetical protein F6J87_06730 [Spirulina sp. SIO3F2]|nr:hypothetical protein [Spirulina sp. SIO3F2]
MAFIARFIALLNISIESYLRCNVLNMDFQPTPCAIAQTTPDETLSPFSNAEVKTMELEALLPPLLRASKWTQTQLQPMVSTFTVPLLLVAFVTKHYFVRHKQGQKRNCLLGYYKTSAERSKHYRLKACEANPLKIILGELHA